MRPTDADSYPAELVSGKRVLLGVTGGISAYKAADLASGLVQRGVELTVAMTQSATRFVGTMTFQALTRRPVYVDVFDGWDGDEAGHVTLAAQLDAAVIAPATANSLANLAHGFAPDMVSTVLLATDAPVIVAPAMEHHMWHHAATQRNVDILRERGVVVVQPEAGRLASGAHGDGRLADSTRIVAALRGVLARGGPMAGSRVVVTAGGTHESIDPVRFIGNNSSGRMGVALSEAAFDAGASVVTIVGPGVHHRPSIGEVWNVTSAEEMARAVNRACEDADVLVMAAAVADFRPEQRSDQKLKKNDTEDAPLIPLTRNVDILANVSRTGLLKVGFAAETNDLLDNASAKLAAKGLDMIVANDAVATIGESDSEATLLFRDGRREPLQRASKEAVARVIIDRVGKMHGND